ncbi:MAG: ATP-binding protein [Polyangiaceae bacterium]|nr:ATP-binding protein [Polyangiaceae bacterium]
MLRSLHMTGVGPAPRFDLELGDRLNVLTGDNGLGKSFVLEVAWWALTGSWVDRPVLPQPGKEESARLKWEAEGRGEGDSQGASVSRFDRVSQGWSDPFRRKNRGGSGTLSKSHVHLPSWLLDTVPVLYVRPDGMFSLWDPVRIHVIGQPADSAQILEPREYHFSPSELWNGLKHDEKTVCNGLIQDWVTWQLEAQSDNAHPFQLLTRVLESLSHPDEKMVPGKPVRLYLDDIRKFPTIELPYETIPVVHASSGMKRILGLAYLVTWMWTEHLQASQITGINPADRIVVLLEEPETHLHPKWQRHIVPALLDVLGGLSDLMRPQILLTTHAPMVLASLEPHFNTETDRLFHFDLQGREVVLEETPWTKRGDALAWLTSDVMDLKEGRSIEAERAITAAYDFMAGRHDKLPQDLTTADAIHAELVRLLPDQDPFWPQWILHRRRQG